MKFRGFVDYNLLTPEEMDDLLFSPFHQALGRQEFERIQKQLLFYDYYEGKQHIDPETGQLVKAWELNRPPGLDYDPTRYSTNYFKAFIQRKARWQMGGKHNVVVNPKQIDTVEETVKPDYTPSPAQEKENKRAADYEALLKQLWKENKMREKLLQAARDRLIAGNVACKILFNAKTGKIHWIFRPATEVIPVYSDDDFEELIAVHFVQPRVMEDGAVIYRKQTFSIEDDGACYLHEAEYDEALNLIRTITEKASMGIDFIPVVMFPVKELSAEDGVNKEAEDLKELNDILNQLNEDAIDSLKFEMFSMTALIGVPEGTSNKMQIAPGAVLEINGGFNGQSVDIKKVEGGFRWKDAYADTYSRIKGAMHEITHIPQVVPQELNFGGLNGEALHVLFHSIIQETEEHWLVWQERLQELHEKTIRYLQARLNSHVFGYDKQVVCDIGDNYDSEIKFVLPLPENRKELVELLALETVSGFESITGAMQRLGVENVYVKKQEIANEKKANMEMFSPYGAQSGDNEPQDEQQAQGDKPNADEGATNTY